MTETAPPGRVTISDGFQPHEAAIAAGLFWAAFRGKLGPLMRPKARALAFLAAAMTPGFALTARDDSGRILGLAGYKTAHGALVQGGWADLVRAYGTFGAVWRAPLLALLEREVQPGVLLMDGIFVAPGARGRGTGSALLAAVKAKARDLGLSSVRLDVIDTNPRARALYERQGFVVGATTRLGPLRHLFGFSASTEMRHTL